MDEEQKPKSFFMNPPPWFYRPSWPDRKLGEFMEKHDWYLIGPSIFGRYWFQYPSYSFGQHILSWVRYLKNPHLRKIKRGVVAEGCGEDQVDIVAVVDIAGDDLEFENGSSCSLFHCGPRYLRKEL